MSLFSTAKSKKTEYETRQLIIDLLAQRGGMCTCQLSYYLDEDAQVVHRLVQDLSRDGLIYKAESVEFESLHSAVDDGIYVVRPTVKHGKKLPG